MQPLLSSVSDDGTTLHTALGQAGTSAETKLKAMSAGPGLKVFSSCDSLSYMLDLSSWHAALGIEDRSLLRTSGNWTQVPALTWGSTSFKVGGLRAHSTSLNVDQASTDVL